jgi:hypothetical protein
MQIILTTAKRGFVALYGVFIKKIIHSKKTRLFLHGTKILSCTSLCQTTAIKISNALRLTKFNECIKKRLQWQSFYVVKHVHYFNAS